MKIDKRPIRASVFGLVIIAFLLPFVVVSCPDHGSVKVTGLQLSTGTRIKGERLSSFTSDQYIKAQPFAYLAFACAFVGIAVSFVKNRQEHLVGLIVSLLGMMLLLLLKNRIGIEAARLAKDSLHVRYAVGYWAAFSLYALSSVVNLASIPQIQSKMALPKRRGNKGGKKR
jgi:hypothetical protein